MIFPEGIYTFALLTALYVGFLQLGLWRTSKGSLGDYDGFLGYKDI